MASFPASRSIDEFAADFDSTPLFMKTLPEDMEDNVTLQALQSLAFSDDPVETAENFKTHGNDWFSQKPVTPATLAQARTYYTRGLAAKCPDAKLNSLLYCNRAAVNIKLENYGTALSDCKNALLLNPDMEKAWYRAALTCIKTDRLAEALDCIERGLQVSTTWIESYTIRLTQKTRRWLFCV